MVYNRAVKKNTLLWERKFWIMKRIIAALLTLALLLMAVPVLAEGDTITVTDHAGNEVVLPREINRIAVTSIYPFVSVLTLVLGSAEKIVGMHPMSYSAAVNGTLGKIFPEIANASTEFMTGSDLNIEALAALEPDVVFYNAVNPQEKELLDAAGIPAVAVSATGAGFDVLKTYDMWVSLLAQIFPDHDKAQAVSDYSAKTLELIQARVAEIPEEQRTRAMFLYQYSEEAMITSGKKFFGQYWITSAGGVNVGQEMEEERAQAQIDMEQVYAWNPDVIFITNFTPAQPDDLYNNAIGGDDWSTVKAVQDGRVFKMPLGSYRTFTPGVDTPMTLLWIAKALYPEQFEDIDLTAQVKEYYQTIYGVTLDDADVAAMYTPSAAAADGAH